MICGCGTKLIRLSVTLVSAQLTQSQHDFAVIHIQASNGHGAFIQITQAKCMQAQYFDFVRRCSVRTPVFLLVAQRSISFFFFWFFPSEGPRILARALQACCLVFRSFCCNSKFMRRTRNAFGCEEPLQMTHAMNHNLSHATRVIRHTIV